MPEALTESAEHGAVFQTARVHQRQTGRVQVREPVDERLMNVLGLRRRLDGLRQRERVAERFLVLHTDVAGLLEDHLGRAGPNRLVHLAQVGDPDLPRGRGLTHRYACPGDVEHDTSARRLELRGGEALGRRHARLRGSGRCPGARCRGGWRGHAGARPLRRRLGAANAEDTKQPTEHPLPYPTTVYGPATPARINYLTD